MGGRDAPPVVHPRLSPISCSFLSLSFFFLIITAVFKDKNTPSPFIETFPEDDEAAKASKPDHIYMDAMGFGMGNCCLQVLFQISREASGPHPFVFINFFSFYAYVSLLKITL